MYPGSSKFFYTIGICFTIGIFTRSFFDIVSWEIALFFFVSASCVALSRIRATGFYSVSFLTGLAFFSFGLGVLRLDISERTTSLLSEQVGTEVILQGIVAREPEISTNTMHLYVKLDGTKEIILATVDRFNRVTYGDHVKIQGELGVPESFMTDGGRTFNYLGYLKARGVRYTVSYAHVEILERGKGNPFLAYLFIGKQYFINALERALPEPDAGLGEGVLLGVKRALGDDLESTFRSAGIIHIVVLSGYNIMIIVNAVTWLLSFALFPRVRVMVGGAVIVSFAILVGLSATVIRASIMAALLLIARATGRTYAITRALVFAGVMMLLINPYLLAFDPGFALSFLATLGLVFLAPKIEERLHLVPSRFGVREFTTATIATQIFVLPFLLYQMGTLSLVALFVNVLVLPMVSPAMLLTFVTGIVAMFHPTLGIIVGFPAHLSLQYIIAIAEVFARLPFASFSVPVFPFWVVILCYAIMGLAFYFFSQREPEEDDKHDKLSEYDDWIIEVVSKNKTSSPLEALDASRGEKNSLPFR